MQKKQSGIQEDYSKSFTCAEAYNDESSIQVTINVENNQKTKKMSDLSKPSPTKEETYTQSATYENCVDTSTTAKNELEPCTGSEQQSSSMMEFQALEDGEELNGEYDEEDDEVVEFDQNQQDQSQDNEQKCDNVVEEDYDNLMQ